MSTARNEIKTGCHLRSMINSRRLIGAASASAVRKESCLGEIFFMENMLLDKVSTDRDQWQVHFSESGPELLKLEFIAYALYSGYTVYSQLLSNLSDMHVNGPVTYDHFVSPDLVEYFISKEYTPGFLGEEEQQFCSRSTLNRFLIIGSAPAEDVQREARRRS